MANNQESGWPLVPSQTQRNGYPLRYLALLLVACAPSAPSQYEQGAYRPPVRAPVFNPATGAPHTVGQPGHVRTPREIPRSPHKRVLPPTREPGIWATENPDDKIVDTAGDRLITPDPFYILNSPVPGPKARTDPDKIVAKACADTMNVAASDALVGYLIMPLATTERNPVKDCVVARLYLVCLENLKSGTPIYDHILRKRIKPTPDVAIERAKRAAKAYERDKCAGQPPHDIVEDFIARAKRKWTKLVDAYGQAASRE